jgi:hypothetical protein
MRNDQTLDRATGGFGVGLFSGMYIFSLVYPLKSVSAFALGITFTSFIGILLGLLLDTFDKNLLNPSEEEEEEQLYQQRQDQE